MQTATIDRIKEDIITNTSITHKTIVHTGAPVIEMQSVIETPNKNIEIVPTGISSFLLLTEKAAIKTVAIKRNRLKTSEIIYLAIIDPYPTSI